MYEGDVSVGSLDCLFTPAGGRGREAAVEARRLDFSGFQGEGQSQGEKMIRRRMYESEGECFTPENMRSGMDLEEGIGKVVIR